MQATIRRMERKESETAGKPEAAETARAQTTDGQRRGSGEGAASALARLNSLERDRAQIRPGNEGPGS